MLRLGQTLRSIMEKVWSQKFPKGIPFCPNPFPKQGHSQACAKSASQSGAKHRCYQESPTCIFQMFPIRASVPKPSQISVSHKCPTMALSQKTPFALPNFFPKWWIPKRFPKNCFPKRCLKLHSQNCPNKMSLKVPLPSFSQSDPKQTSPQISQKEHSLSGPMKLPMSIPKWRYPKKFPMMTGLNAVCFMGIPKTKFLKIFQPDSKKFQGVAVGFPKISTPVPTTTF